MHRAASCEKQSTARQYNTSNTIPQLQLYWQAHNTKDTNLCIVRCCLHLWLLKTLAATTFASQKTPRFVIAAVASAAAVLVYQRASHNSSQQLTKDGKECCLFLLSFA
jgi:hypothetical protein